MKAKINYKNMMTLKLFILLGIILNQISAQIDRCKTVDEFEYLAKDNITPALDIRTYMGAKEFTGPPSGFTSLGKGSFGFVFEAKLQSWDNVGIPGAFKAINYRFGSQTDLNNEIEFLQKISPKHPLFFIKYYTCVKQTQNKKVILITEKLDSPLDELTSDVTNVIKYQKTGEKLLRGLSIDKKAEFKAKVDKFKGLIAADKNTLFRAFVGQTFVRKIELLLNMALSVYAVHLNKYAHYDIKPANFMVKNGKFPIIKLIDYGIVYKIEDRTPGDAVFGERGTPNYVDPNIFSDNHVPSYNSDVFSLGVTFIEVFLGENVDLDEKKINYDNLKTILQANQSRKYNFDRSLTVPKSTKIDFQSVAKTQMTMISILKTLFLEMVNLSSDKRINMRGVVLALYCVVRRLKPASNYLPENINQLFSAVYDNSITALGPIIEDEQSDELTSNYSFPEISNNTLFSPSLFNEKLLVDLVTTELRLYENQRIEKTKIEMEKQFDKFDILESEDSYLFDDLETLRLVTVLDGDDLDDFKLFGSLNADYNKKVKNDALNKTNDIKQVDNQQQKRADNESLKPVIRHNDLQINKTNKNNVSGSRTRNARVNSKEDDQAAPVQRVGKLVISRKEEIFKNKLVVPQRKAYKPDLIGLDKASNPKHGVLHLKDNYGNLNNIKQAEKAKEVSNKKINSKERAANADSSKSRVRKASVDGRDARANGAEKSNEYYKSAANDRMMNQKYGSDPKIPRNLPANKFISKQQQMMLVDNIRI